MGLVLRLRVFSRIREAPSITCFRSSYMEPVTSNTKARVDALSSDPSSSSAPGTARSLCALIQSTNAKYFDKKTVIFFFRFTASVCWNEANQILKKRKKKRKGFLKKKSLDFSVDQILGALPIGGKSIWNNAAPLKENPEWNTFTGEHPCVKFGGACWLAVCWRAPGELVLWRSKRGRRWVLKGSRDPTWFFVCACVCVRVCARARLGPTVTPRL